MCFFIVMEIGNSNNPPFTPLDPESGIRIRFFSRAGSGSGKKYRIRNTDYMREEFSRLGQVHKFIGHVFLIYI